MFDVRSGPEVPQETGLVARFVVSDDLGASGVDADVLSAVAFEGKDGQTYLRTDAVTTLLVGLGAQGEVTLDGLRRAAATVSRAAHGRESAAVTVPPELPDRLGARPVARAVAEGLVLGAYKYTEFKSAPKEAKLASVTVVAADADGLADGVRIAQAVNLARDLVNAPPGRSTPKRLVEVAGDVAEQHGLALTVWDETDIEREGLGGLRGVSLGSDEPPRYAELVYTPDGPPAATLAFVGKGITFDSGGLSLKPAAGMMTMKTDMSGAAAVIAAMSVIGAIRPNVKVVGIICATENLPGPKATKPGDVLKARNGKTMEVLNTDAEGRLVLADGLSLAVEKGVDAIVDLATLTGACVVALGNDIAGLMTNNDEWAARVRTAADRAGESVWPLPLPTRYRKHIDSEIADIKNIGASGGAAGALTAGLFLKEFVGETPWVHLDIAGPARAESDDGYTVKGGTGFGVRTLIDLVGSYS